MVRWVLTLFITILISFSYSKGVNPHLPFDRNCQDCHTNQSWSPLKANVDFNHDETGYPLLNQHQFVDCTSCHTSLKFNEVGVNCVDCHSDIHKGTNGLDCDRCHNTEHWVNDSKWDSVHAERGFPLLGEHSVLNCVECHTNAPESYIGLSQDCASCHLPDYQSTSSPSHSELGFSTNCRECHSSAAWQPGEFDHDSTGFPLSGTHQGISCNACHKNNFVNVTADCAACHIGSYNASTNPNHIQSGFPTNCQLCHNTDDWDSGTFDHDTTGFSLVGAHAQASCNACHSSGFSGTPSTCVSCHQSDYNATTNPNHAQAGFSTDCKICHTATDWESGTFDHDTTGFSLVGAHDQASCNACHSSGFSGTPSTCVACHQSDYDATTNPNHAQAGFSTDCQTCHTSTEWESGTFDHDTTGFSLVGAHAQTSCNLCHSSGFSGTPTDCASCHQSDYDATTNPNHSQAGFPTDCQTCHTTTDWESASFDHDTTGFSLVGAHAQANCSSCHSSGFSGTPTDCASCHQSDYDATTNPNHAQAGFSTSCQTCHNTTDWESATFDHDTTGYSLVGAHAQADCSACHSSGYSGTSTTCVSCHQADYNASTNPNHSQAGFPTDCQICHNTNDWESGSFDHDSTGFSLDGAHQSLNCSSCHASSFSGTPSDCYSCHQSDYTNTSNPNHSASGFSTNCLDCHTTSNWNSSFSHNSFPIYSGTHQGEWSSCSECHQNSSNYSEFTCLLCHEHRRSKMDDEHDDVGGYSYQSSACYSCHPDGRD